VNNGFFERLNNVNARTAQRYQQVERDIALSLTQEDLTQWSTLCCELAEAGWHAWETADKYIELSQQTLTQFGPTCLVSVGGFGLTLCKNSFEPANVYFEAVHAGFPELNIERLKLIESVGQVLTERFKQAASLVARYFNCGFSISRLHDIDTVKDWCDIASQQISLGRPEMLALIEATEQHPTVNWRFAHSLYKISPQTGQAYVLSFGFLMNRLTSVEREFETLVLKYAESEQPMEGLYAALNEAIPQLQSNSVNVLIRLLQKIPRAELAQALVETCAKPPLSVVLSNQTVMSTWIETGLDLLPLKPDSALAFLKLESSKSTDLLEQLLGQVRFSEEQRMLQLYSEALVGTRLKIVANDLVEQEYRSLPSSDGQSVFLPEIVGRYEDKNDNFRWMKVALCHQLGCYEFGTFDFKYKNSHVPFGDYFRTFYEPRLAADLFKILEDGRIDWRMQTQYKGIAKDLDWLKQDEIAKRPSSPMGGRNQLLELLTRYSLDFSLAPSASSTPDTNATLDSLSQSDHNGQFLLDAEQSDLQAELIAIFQPLRSPSATVFDSIQALQECYVIVSQLTRDKVDLSGVDFRGRISLDKASMNLELTAIEDADVEFTEDEDGISLTGAADTKDVKIDEIKKGDVQDASSVMLGDQDMEVDDELEHVDEPGGSKEFEELKNERDKPIPETAYKYDEWDYTIEDYRKRWCTLYEIRAVDEDVDFVPNLLSEHRGLANQVRKQLNMLRPEMLRKVKGMFDGEELDLERAVEAVVNRKSGVSPDENIYVQRQRKDRDVSALFLLDMSASTDDPIPDPDNEPAQVSYQDDEDFMRGYYDEFDQMPKDTRKKIIDLEKESVVLMAEALQGLGDSYSVCGFSGYGRDRVDYFICKDFEEPYNHKVKARIGGIKPCRSTRMGPAIRHATNMLAATESRIKALIIISDGYPQDHDYGADRNSKDYGIKDTTKALSEATQKGVQSFCLTVDPSGHDYLREMCPDQQYMVMQDLTQLPSELSKVYRGLTT
jgi:nitric oxide reductase NorD protein